MKKLLPIILCASILLAGCGNSNSEDSSSVASDSTSVSASEPASSSEASSEPASESTAAEEAQTDNLESAVAALEAVNPISNPAPLDDDNEDSAFRVENELMLTMDNLVAYRGDITNDQADCGLVFVVQAKEGKAADVEAELQAYKDSLSANNMYAEFADKIAMAEDARIVTNGNYVAIVIASIGSDYGAIDTALETALNFRASRIGSSSRPLPPSVTACLFRKTKESRHGF